MQRKDEEQVGLCEGDVESQSVGKTVITKGAEAEPSSHTVLLVAGFSTVATMSITILNKACLAAMGVPSAAGALTLLHASIGFAFVRVWFGMADYVPPSVPWKNLFVTTAVGTLGIVASNVTLKLGTVAFHQLARLANLPLAAALDYLLKGKTKDCVDLVLILLLAFAVVLGTTGDVMVTPMGVVSALVHSTCHVGCAAMIKSVIQEFELTSTDFMYVSGPYMILNAFLLTFLLTLMSEGFSRLSADSSASITIDSYVIGLLVANLASAIAVQYLSTWMQSKVSGTMYAVLANVKTVCTVALGTVMFQQDQMSPQMFIALVLAVGVVFSLSYREERQRTGSNKN